MSSISKESIPITIDTPAYQARTTQVGDLTLAFETIKVSHDATPMFKGLPDDRCPCPHWGVMTSGRMTLNYPDGDKVYVAGDTFYMPPGHIPTAADPGTEFITFSPTDELNQVWAVVAANAAAMAH